MRLLSTTTLEFSEFITDPPRYAILSHTWGSAGEEVTYDDVLGGTGKSKAGDFPTSF